MFSVVPFTGMGKSGGGLDENEDEGWRGESRVWVMRYILNIQMKMTMKLLGV